MDRLSGAARASPRNRQCDYRATMNAFPIRSAAGPTALLLLAALPGAAAHSAPLDYRFDPLHSSLYFRADHMGFSTSVGRFARWQGKFTFDPDNPTANRVDLSVEIGSLALGDANWNRTLLGRKWFDVERYPQARFVASRWEALGEGRARLHGELTLKGVSAPLALEVRVNRVGTHPYTLKATAGFSATATLSRAAFGLDALPGTLADAVELQIEVEGQLTQPLARRPGKKR